MENISTYSATIIQVFMEAKEISYYELKKYFANTKLYPDKEEIEEFNLDEEIDKLKKMGILSEDEGLLIYEGI